MDYVKLVHKYSFFAKAYKHTLRLCQSNCTLIKFPWHNKAKQNKRASGKKKQNKKRKVSRLWLTKI